MSCRTNRGRRRSIVVAQLIAVSSALAAGGAEAEDDEASAWKAIEALVAERSTTEEAARRTDTSRFIIAAARLRLLELDGEIVDAAAAHHRAWPDGVHAEECALAYLDAFPRSAPNVAGRAELPRLATSASLSAPTAQLALERWLRSERARLRGKPALDGYRLLDAIESAMRAQMGRHPEHGAWPKSLLELAELTVELGLVDDERLLRELSAVTGSAVAERADVLLRRREGAAIDIAFRAVDGREVDLAALRGRVVLVDFWATWCGPCVAELPNVIRAHEKLHERGFEVVGVSLDSDRRKLEDFVRERSLPWPQHFDGRGWRNRFADHYGIQAVPTAWLVGKDGRIADARARGGLESRIEALLGSDHPTSAGLPAWSTVDGWAEAGDATLGDGRALVPAGGTGILVATPGASELATRAEYAAIDLHAEFLLADGATARIRLPSGETIAVSAADAPAPEAWRPGSWQTVDANAARGATDEGEAPAHVMLNGVPCDDRTTDARTATRGALRIAVTGSAALRNVRVTPVP